MVWRANEIKAGLVSVVRMVHGRRVVNLVGAAAGRRGG